MPIIYVIHGVDYLFSKIQTALQLSNAAVESPPMKAITVSLTLVGLVAFASADSLKEQINASGVKIGNAMKKKDMKAFEKIVKAGVTSDFKYIENGQSMTFDQMFQMMKSSFTMMDKVTTAENKILSLKESGKSATAKVRHTMAGTMKLQDNKVHKFTMTGVSHDTYKKVGKEWKMSIMDWKESKMTMDGKPFDPTKMGG